MKRKAVLIAADSVETAITARAKKSKQEAYTSSQNQAITDLRAIINQDKSTAVKLLKDHNWNVNNAVNGFYSNPGSGGNATIRKNLTKIFDKFRDEPKEEPDEINAEGTSNLLGELQISLEDVGALVFSELVQSPSLGRLTRQGFVDGWHDIGVDNVAQMKTTVSQRRSALATDKELFKKVYNHTFQLALAPGAKTLPIEMAVVFWRLLLSPPGFDWRTKQTPWLDWWLQFQEDKRTKAINKDLWKQTLNFAQQAVKDDSLSFWSDESSWPSVIDEFVQWVKKEKRAGTDAMAVD